VGAYSADPVSVENEALGTHCTFLGIQGSLDSKVARKAFTRAAREAGILVER
jgi:hypothetical protein